MNKPPFIKHFQIFCRMGRADILSRHHRNHNGDDDDDSTDINNSYNDLQVLMQTSHLRTTKHSAKPCIYDPALWEFLLGNQPNQSSFGPKTKNPVRKGSFECDFGPSHLVLKPPLKTILIHYTRLILSYLKYNFTMFTSELKLGSSK